MNSALLYENIELPQGQTVKSAYYQFSPEDRCDIAPHFHMMFEVMLFVKGAGKIFLDGTEFPIQDGTLLYLPSLSVHEMVMEYGEQEFFLLQFEPQVMDELSLGYTAQDMPSAVCRLQDKMLQRLTMMLHWCCEVNVSSEQLLLRNRVLQLLLIQIEKVVIQEDAADVSRSTGLGRLEPVLKYFQDSSKLSLTLDQAADLCGISRSHFSRLFHATLNLRYQDFLLKRKLQHAVQLLSTSNLRIADIAFQCEFSDSAHFCSKFKRVFGVTPQAFRKTTVESL
ncbi:AraC family transcriptional regulator [Microbulbifer sp. ALW1]|uniref:helix-turn-helix transcriptional regulator n=1 Tax=Microbulbifer sp. (strain ALW1) TaxID=1516059 RepID=UPI0019134D77|nr:AraC family transcriptional regulator [Microbulbifer sp. ALW1]